MVTKPGHGRPQAGETDWHQADLVTSFGRGVQERSPTVSHPVVGNLASHIEITVTVCHQAEKEPIGEQRKPACPRVGWGAARGCGRAEWGGAPAPRVRSSLESGSDRRMGLRGSTLNSGGLVGSHPAAFVDIEWPVVRL